MTHAHTQRRRGRGIILWAAIGAVALILGIVAIVVFIVLPSTSTAPPSNSATAEVGEDGFRLELEGGVVITGGPDVAAAGTEVTAEIVDQDIPGDFGSFATPVAPVVDITLGDDLQPKAPLTATFTFTKEEAQSLQTDRLFALGESDTEGREVDFVEGVWDNAERTMTVTIEHLSWYTVTQVDDQSLGEQFGEWVDQQMAVRTPKPACVDEPIQPSGSYVLSTPWPNAAWVCATETDDTVTVKLQSNSGLVYEILSRPDGEYAPLAAVSPSGVLTTYVARLVEEKWNALEGDGVLLAGGNMEITYDKPFESAYIELKIEPALSQISSIVFGTSMLLPAGAQETLDWYGCGASSLESLAGSSVGPTILSCVAAGAKGVAGKLLSIIATGPGLVATQLEGAAKTFTGENVEGFTVSLVAADAIRELPAGASWLFEHTTEGYSTSGEEDIAELAVGGDSVASYPFSTNQWVSCTSRPVEARYALDGKWKTLSYALALQEFAPEALTATVEITGDGRVLFSGPVVRGPAGERAELDVTGVQELVVSAITDDSCTNASEGYGALVQAYLR